MKPAQIPKWQEQVEAILGKKYQGDELLTRVQQVNAFLALANDVDVPSGDIGASVLLMLKWASDELRPLVATYAAFQLGVAYERYQNGNRT